MKQSYTYTWFTLIEMIVALTIFSMTMVSVLMIFYLSSQMSIQVELNRFMQENVKNTFDIIAEDVRTWSIEGVRWFEAQCDPTHQRQSHILCLSSGLRNIEIALWEKISETDWSLVSDMAQCQDITSQCYVIKREQVLDTSSWDPSFTEWYPLTNSKSHVTLLEFQFLGEAHPRVSLQVGIRPAIRQWMATHIVEQQEIIVQTTLSERYIQQF